MTPLTSADGDLPSGFHPIGAVEQVERLDAGVRLSVGRTTVEVVVLAPGLFRVGMFADGRPSRYPTAAIALEQPSTASVEVGEADGVITLTTSAGSAHVQCEPLRLGFRDSAGRPVADDVPELGMGTLSTTGPSGPLSSDVVGAPTRVYKRRAGTERYFACGERTGGLDKTGSRQTFWNVDPPVWHTASHDNLYTSIPFVLAVDATDGRSWGMFFDNPGRVQIDLARERNERVWFGAALGDLVYYVLVGPTPREVLERYTLLTGRTPMPPLWALGYHQSRWGYASEDDLREVARELRRRDIPCDALHLDIDYMDGYRVFTWDREDFPDPSRLLSDLGRQGFRVVTIVDPGVKVDEGYDVYREGRAAGAFCRTADGQEYHNAVWPGVCAFPDFLSKRVRSWWGDRHRSLLDDGVAGIWCDMNEPALGIPRLSTMPSDVVHASDGSPRYHGEVHNLYGMQMARATYEGLRRLRPDRRPLVISRSGYAGLQRYALQWTGDNSSWWEHLAMSMPQLQNMGLSGIAWSGVDVGGFWDDASGELLARWMELGAFQPFCRNHSEKTTRRQEPWAFGEPYETVVRTMLKLRQRLIPYLYSLFEECHRTGAPILRPLLFEHPSDPETFHADDELMLGHALLLAPITRQGQTYRHVYLPRGSWFHWWSGARFDGPTHVLAHAPLGQPALYVRGDAPVPMWPEMSYVGERAADPLTIRVHAAGGSGTSVLYEDAGDGYGYERGDFVRRVLACGTEAERVEVTIGAAEGAFEPSRSALRLELHGAAETQRVRVGDAPAEDWHMEDGMVVVRLPSVRDEQRIELTR